MMNTVKAQKGNYISIETGAVYGGSVGKIKQQMNADGLGDDEEKVFGALYGTRFPKKFSNSGSLLIRFGRELSKDHFLDIAGGLMQNVTVTGFDKFGSSSIEILHGSYGNYLSFNSKTYSISANYIFTNQKQNAGIGLGPALVYCS